MDLPGRFFQAENRRPVGRTIPSAVGFVLKRLCPGAILRIGFVNIIKLGRDAKRLVVIIIDTHPQLPLHAGGLSLNLLVNVNVAVYDFDRLMGQRNKPLDIILPRIGGVFENDDIPSLRRKKRIKTF
jgi:hypothetical protein